MNGGETLSFGDWETRSLGVARGLIEAGVTRGQRVGLVFSGMEWIGYAIAYMGVLLSGGTAVHLNDLLSVEEVRRRIRECEISGFIVAPGATVPEDFTGWTRTVASLTRLDGPPVDVTVRPEDIADVFYTSGTTGPPKAYAAPHGNLTYRRDPEAFEMSGDASYSLMPMWLGTTTSATIVNVAFASPATIVLCDPNDVERMAELIARFRIGFVMITPWIAIQMVDARIHERHDLSSVQTLASGSAPLPPAVANALLEMMPAATISTACSQSEAGPALVVGTYDPGRPASLGRPTPWTDLRIVDPDGQDLPQGEVGEIWLRCSAPKRLYLDRPELNARVLEDGWYQTGDLGRIGADGDLYFFDRAVDTIRVDGHRVSSVEVENALYECEAVLEAAAVGLPQRGASQRLVAAVVPRAGRELGDLAAFVADRLAPHQRPRRFVPLDALPRTQNGKVLKRRLRELLAAPGPRHA